MSLYSSWSIFAGVTQLVEYITRNDEVESSNLFSSSIFKAAYSLGFASSIFFEVCIKISFSTNFLNYIKKTNFTSQKYVLNLLP